MHWKIFVFAVPALVAGSALAAIPDRPASATGDTSVGVQVAQCSRYGPYATIRRANEVANQARAYGYSAMVYPEWGAYYVNVC